MAIIQTDEWIEKYIDHCSVDRNRSEYSIQQDVVCKPMQKYFPKSTVEEIHQFLLAAGLFAPIYYKDFAEQFNKLKQKNVWKIVREEYEIIKKAWSGKEVDLLIFPINMHEHYFKKELGGKNGFGFADKILLFFNGDIKRQDIQILIIHEYNHVCRLNHLGLTPEEIPLKDSLIIEGLAEVAVRERLGEDAVAPFAKQYSMEEAQLLWKKHLQTNLELKGVTNHKKFLYGSHRIPKRLGYCVGYQIINSYLKNHHESIIKLLEIPTDDILEGSEFSQKQKG